jgi:hypothetical protein
MRSHLAHDVHADLRRLDQQLADNRAGPGLDDGRLCDDRGDGIDDGVPERDDAAKRLEAARSGSFQSLRQRNDIRSGSR